MTESDTTGAIAPAFRGRTVRTLELSYRTTENYRREGETALSLGGGPNGTKPYEQPEAKV